MESLEPQVSIVIPLYNEEEIFPLLVKRLNAVMENLNLRVEVVMVNDGSMDRTPLLMKELSQNDKRYQCVFFSRNFGHQAAITAGMRYAKGTEGVMVIDGDLQDPPEMLSEFYEKFEQGYDVIYAIRKNRKAGRLKKILYYLYYRILSSISSIRIPLDSGDFSFMSRRVIDILNSLPEESRYIRGLRSWTGFKQIGIEYNRDDRVAGKSKYSLKKLFQLAFNGIFNFSEFPIKVIMRLGILSIIISSLYLGFTLFRKMFYGDVPQGFTSILFVIVLFSGIQMIFLGLIGEYILRIFFQVKGRPPFIVSERIENGMVINPITLSDKFIDRINQDVKIHE